MFYIYVDNYRGFSNTYIPIKNVNFLVGENSTGKTSILSLINLLASPEFWLQQDFNTPDLKLGSYKDIVSANSRNKSFFRIGVIEIYGADTANKDTSSKSRSHAFMMTFVADEGLPIIHSYHYASGIKQIKIIFLEQRILYRTSEAVEGLSESNALKIFTGWSQEELDKGKGYTFLKGNLPFSRKDALGQIGNLIQSIYDEKVLERTVYHLILPKFARKLIWVAPIRSKPKRTYDEYKVNSSPEGDHIPYLLSKIFRNTSLSKTFLDFLDKFGQESGLFETIKIKRFGRNIDAPFELDVVFNKMPMKISNVGYGVSQALPIIVELFLRSKGHWFAIQQPEVHLHPKAQAAFGDLIYKVAIDENKNFFVETHSDYLIDRFRLNYRSQRSELSIPSQVLFFERTDEGNRVYPIDIMENGNYSDDQPENFRDFFIHEELRILGV